MSIFGIGTDIVDINRMKTKLEKDGFRDLVFTTGEIRYCHALKHEVQSYAARFAAKEAYMKALGTGWSNEANFQEIELIKNPAGAPRISLSGETKKYFDKSNLKNIFVTVSHTEMSAAAFVILTY